MTYDQAQKILDRVRDGVNYPPGIVDFALCLTGDLDAHETHGSQGVGSEIQTQGQPGRGSSSTSLVGRYYFGN
jgi:hypothetical protein